MRIVIDISQIVYGTGVSVYTKRLVESLLTLDKANEYLLFAGTLRQKQKLKDFIDFLRRKKLSPETRFYPFPPRFLDWLWNKKHILPLEILVGKRDIFLASDWTQPPAKKTPVITVVHDLVPWLYPETQDKLTVSVHKRRMAWVKKEAAAVIVDSLSTKNDFLRLTGFAAEKVHVVYPGVDHQFFFPRKPGEIRRIKKKYHLKDYFLSVGTQEPRKNLERLVRVWQNMAVSAPLVLVGKTGWGKRASFSSPKVLSLGYVPREDLPALYSGAKAFFYPSLYEGFGLPVLEAMACGCPVLTSNTSSLPEVAGEAAVLVDPADEKSLAQGIRKIVYGHSLARKLSSLGKKQAQKFSWSQTAKGVLAVFSQVNSS